MFAHGTGNNGDGDGDGLACGRLLDVRILPALDDLRSTSTKDDDRGLPGYRASARFRHKLLPWQNRTRVGMSPASAPSSR